METIENDNVDFTYFPYEPEPDTEEFENLQILEGACAAAMRKCRVQMKRPRVILIEAELENERFADTESHTIGINRELFEEYGMIHVMKVLNLSFVELATHGQENSTDLHAEFSKALGL